MQINRKRVSGATLILLWIGIPIFLFNGLSVKAEPMTIIVPDDYPTIQGAINAASHGDTIFVKIGTYRESIAVNRSVLVIGEKPSETIIDGRESENVVIVSANDVVITNFILRRSGILRWSGIKLESVNNCTIKYNNIADNSWGVFLEDSSNNRIIYNNMTASTYDGVYLLNSFNNTISENNITNNTEYGIGLYKSSNNSVSGNNITQNNRAGIWLENSRNNAIRENEITANRWNGILLEPLSSNNSIYRNNIMANENGILLVRGAPSNTISANYVTASNSEGIVLGSSNNSITRNRVTNNAAGIKIVSCSNNTVSENTLSDNGYNLDIYGLETSHFLHSIATSNLVDGKSVYYLVNQKDVVLNAATQPQVGYLAVINSTNVTAQGLTLTKNGQGLLIAYSNNLRIIGNNIMGNEKGVILYRSLSNNIIENNVASNSKEGISLESGSHYNNVSGNLIANNLEGIDLEDSSNNSLRGNRLTNNLISISFFMSSGNKLRDNVMTGNNYTFDFYGGRLVHFIHDISTSNTVDGNPVHYLINQSNLFVSPSTFSAVGYLALVNSTDITVEGLNLEKSGSILLAFTINTRIRSNYVANSNYGIQLYNSSSSSVSQNIIKNNFRGISLVYYSSKNYVFRNNITDNQSGINLQQSNNNTIYENNIAHDWESGVDLVESSENRFYHNNFINNIRQTSIFFFDRHLPNSWDNGYPSGGNYWSDYEGSDGNGDGIGDTLYSIDRPDQDNFPLVNPWSPSLANVFEVVSENNTYSVAVLSNSTITEYLFNQTLAQISFSVIGLFGTAGYCNITIPNNLLKSPWTITIDGVPIDFVESANSTNSFIYINYTHMGTRKIVIQGTRVAAEFPFAIILLLLTPVIALLVALAWRRFLRKKKPEKPKSDSSQSATEKKALSDCPLLLLKFLFRRASGNITNSHANQH